MITRKFHRFVLLLMVWTLCSMGLADVGSGLVAWDGVEIPQSADAPVTLRCGDIALKGKWAGPELIWQKTRELSWRHVSRQCFDKALPPYTGKVTEDCFADEGMELVRQVWVSEAKDCAAVRVTVWNRGEEAIQLGALIPWQSVGEESMCLGEGISSDRWELQVQYWRKNGLPQAIRPEGEWSMEHDQFVLWHVRDDQTQPTVRMGYLEQMGHLSRFQTEFEKQEDKTVFKSFSARCLFNGCEVPPGGSRTSNWLIFTVHENPGESMHEYAERVADYYGIAQPGPAPTVWCSWYYYGKNIHEQDFYENLEYLKRNPLPYDVVLIDDGWMPYWGDWVANEKWPSGMKAASERIRACGYRPGLWTCPYIADPESKTAKEHPNWLMRHSDGTLHYYNNQHVVLDPTYPGVCDYLEDLYRRLTFDEGFTYHKMDFMRAVMWCRCDKANPKRVILYDRTATPVEAYRRGLEAIRRGVGPDAYIAVCGGNYGGSLGIANCQRSGSDIKSYWSPERVEDANQNLLRTWMRRLWHTDADSMMVRRREQENPLFGDLSVGRFTDEEAQTISLHQYISGGIVCLSENLPEIDDDRLELYKHVIPLINSPGIVLDAFNPFCPSQVLTRVKPVCAELGGWVTAAVMNFTEADQAMSLLLSDKVIELLPLKQYLVSEFYSQKVLGLFKAGDVIDLGVLKAHHSRLVRIAPWDGKKAVLAGTDLHYSGGGAEISEWHANTDVVQGRLETDWRYPVNVTVAFPTADSYVLQSTTLSPGQKKFRIIQPAD